MQIFIIKKVLFLYFSNHNIYKELKMSKKESAKSIIFLFLAIIISLALIIIFSYRDTNIGFAKEIETNMQTYIKTTY